METFNFGDVLTIIAGVRVEKEDNNYHSRFAPSGIAGFPVASGVIRDTSSAYTETITLPNFHVVIRPVDFLNIRLAAYQALARPDFNFRLNKGVAAGAGSASTLLLGNPNLRTAKAWNYEINTSFFGNDIGLISISGFYKEIRDLQHMLNGASTSGNKLIDTLGIHWRSTITGTYQLTVPYNSPELTKVWGMEYEHQMNFGFLPGLLKNIVLSYNFSIVRTKTVLLSTVTDTTYYFLPGFPGIPFPQYTQRLFNLQQKLEGQPEFYGNISLGYDFHDFSIRASVFHQGSYNNTFSANGQSDGVVNSFTRVDLALKQKITDNISLMLNVNNITGTDETRTNINRIENGRILADTGERYGTTVDLGIWIDC